MADCTCCTCGATFNLVPAAVAAGKGKFCSTKCRHAGLGFRRQVRAALPGTLADIAERSGIAAGVVRRQLVRLQVAGQAHPSHLVKLQSTGKQGGCLTAIWYEVGPCKDQDMPTDVRPAHVYLVRKELLAAMPGTQVELIARTGSTQGSMPRLIAELHGATLYHISGWKKGGGRAPTAIYSAGAGKDRVCGLVPLTKSQVNQRYKKRLAKRGLLDEYRARQAETQRAVTLRKRGDPLINALFGKSRSASKESV